MNESTPKRIHRAWAALALCPSLCFSWACDEAESDADANGDVDADGDVDASTRTPMVTSMWTPMVTSTPTLMAIPTSTRTGTLMPIQMPMRTAGISAWIDLGYPTVEEP